jgi:hypothetical protein
MFNPGDPVKTCASISIRLTLGKVIAVMSPIMDGMGIRVNEPTVLVQPAGRKFTSIMYYEDELDLCECADRTPRKAEPCVKSAPF